MAFLVLAPLASFAADFAAEIVDVYGQVLITPKATGKTVAAVKGMKVVPGDALETKAKAELELLYDDGNITRIDEKTKITITRMSLEDDKSKQTVLNLAVGRVKNSVSKLSHEKSRFEVQTASAVAGVTGTPPWIVAAIGEPGKNQKVEVDLLPEKAGVKTPTAGVFVKGTDPGATKVTLTPGTGTFALAGKPPVMPAPIPPAKLQQLQTAMKITTPPQVQEQKKQELEKKVEEKKDEPKEEKKQEEKKDKEEAAKEEEKKTEESKAEEKKEEAKAEESKKEESKQEESKQEASKEEPKETPKETAADGGEKKADAAGGGDKPADTASTGESSGGGDAASNSASASEAANGGSTGGDGGGAAEAVSATGAGGGATPDIVSSASGTAVAENPSPAAPTMASAKDSAPSPVPAPSAPSAGAFSGGFTGGGTTGAAGSPDTGSMMNHLTSNVSVGNTVPGTTASTSGDATGAAALPGANQNTLPAAMTKVRVLVTITNQ